mgnify:CR=1 FL=1
MALGPIQSSAEMNQTLDALEVELAQVPGYVAEFDAIFGTIPNWTAPGQAWLLSVSRVLCGSYCT